MLARKLKYYGYRLAPRPAAAVQRYLQRWARRRRGGNDTPASSSVPIDVVEQARSLAERSRGVRDLEQVVDLAFRYGGIAPNQNRGEILGLLGILRDMQPERLCEIGSAAGGTLFLLSRIAHPNARILSIDLNDNATRTESLRLLVQPGQQLTCVRGDSHQQRIFQQFHKWIGDDKLDFLFIDGDHTYEGVACDHRMYGPRVKPGGFVAFHDIAPDYKTRYGVDTGTYAGGVPEYWAEVKPRHARCTEFVDHRLQDGRGIGVIELAEDPEHGPGSC